MNGRKILKEKDKPRKERSHPLSWWQKKADDRCQEIGRRIYQYCEVCGKPMSCLHHFFPKSVSSRLRYDWDNLIPICRGCHSRHHQAGDPRIHETIKRSRGGDGWYDALVRRKYEAVKLSKSYYELILEKLENHLERKLE